MADLRYFRSVHESLQALTRAGLETIATELASPVIVMIRGEP